MKDGKGRYRYQPLKYLHQGTTATKEGIIVRQFHLLNRWTKSKLIDWEYLRYRVESRGPTYVAKVITMRGPGQWVPNDEYVIDRLRVQYWINVMKQDWGDQISPTMTGRGHSVLIWGQRCRTLLGDKGEPLSGDKGTRTDKHDTKIQQGRMARVWTDVYAYTFGRSALVRAVSDKWMILRKRRPRFVCVPPAQYFW